MCSPCYFYYRNCTFDQNSGIKNDMVSNGGISKIFFIISFRPEILKFHPYSILTGDTKVEFVIYCVLIEPCLKEVLFEKKKTHDHNLRINLDYEVAVRDETYQCTVGDLTDLGLIFKSLQYPSYRSINFRKSLLFTIYRMI